MSGLKFESQSESILYLYSDLKVPIVMVALEQHHKDTSYDTVTKSVQK